MADGVGGGGTQHHVDCSRDTRSQRFIVFVLLLCVAVFETDYRAELESIAERNKVFLNRLFFLKSLFARADSHMEAHSRATARYLFGDGAAPSADLRAALDRRLVAALASAQRAAQGDAD